MVGVSIGKGNIALNARPLDYHHRLIVDFVSIKMSEMCRAKNDFVFPAKSTL